MTDPKTYNVLFVCTGNSARSILAEALMNRLGRTKGFRAFSAGSKPKGQVHPLALQLLAEQQLPVDGVRSKSWDEFAAAGAPAMDFVITVCDQAAGEVCPVWPGQPITAHWGQPDPAAFEGTEAARKQAFLDAFITLKRRIELMLELPVASLTRFALARQLQSFGKRDVDTPMVNVLILCTHNSARSVLAEAMLNHLASRYGRAVRAHSAGSTPSGRLNPVALEVLRSAGVDTSDLRSKSWDEFSGQDAPPLSIVITVCDSAAAETCPVFFGGGQGQPLKVHWGYPDPSNAEGGEDGKRRAFELTRQAIGYRMLQLLDLLDTVDLSDATGRDDVRAVLEGIGKS